MPTIKIPSDKDAWTGQMVARYYGESGDEKFLAARQVSTVVLSAGIAPSYAFLSTPMKEFGPGSYDELAPSVALKKTGPAGNLKLLTRAEVSYTEQETRLSQYLMTGWLVSHSHQFHEDSLIQEIYDDRLALDAIRVLGRLVYDPSIERFYWDLAEPCIFNDLGYPNCIDSPLGPVFAPCHRYGYTQQWNGSDTTEPAKGQALKRARSFDCDDGQQYLRLVYWASRNNGLPPLPVDIGETKLPWYIDWPERAGDVFKHARKLNMDGGFVVDNMTLLEALQTICQKAGRYDLYVQPIGSFRSRIVYLDMNPGPYAKIQLYLQDFKPFTIADCLKNPAIVKEGFALENGKKYRHNTRIIGDAPSVEMMLSMAVPQIHMGPYQFALEPAWSKLDEAAFKNFVTSGGGVHDLENTEGALKIASAIWPWVYAAYRVRLDFNPWIGTKWEKMVPAGRIRFKPFLNTWLQGNNQNPRNCQPREIPVEIFRADGAPASWERASLFDNLTLSPDRTVAIFSGLRENGETYYINDPQSNGKYGANLTARAVRFTAALEAHWVIVGAADDDPNDTAVRVQQGIKFTHAMRAAQTDYSELLRRGDAAPLGAANIGAQWRNWPPKCTAANELFSDRQGDAVNPDITGRIMVHAKSKNIEQRRVEPNAALRVCRIAPGYHPGMGIELLGKDTIRYEGVLKSVKFAMIGTSMQDASDKAPDTWLELGPPEIEIAGGNVQGGQATEAGSEGAYHNETKTDEYDTPREDPKESDSGGGGGPGQPQDDYEKAEAAKNAPAKAADAGNKPAEAPEKQTTSKRSDDAGERKVAAKGARASKSDNRLANMQDKYDSMDADDKGRGALEKKMRAESKKGENAHRQEADARAKGPAADKLAGFGKGGSGRMTVQDREFEKDKDGKPTGRYRDTTRGIDDLHDASFLGKAGSGRMSVQDKEIGKDGKPTGRNVSRDVSVGEQARNLSDTSKGDAFNEKQFNERKGKENAGQQRANDAAASRGAAYQKQLADFRAKQRGQVGAAAPPAVPQAPAAQHAPAQNAPAPAAPQAPAAPGGRAGIGGAGSSNSNYRGPDDE